jgi:hypothetical protein
MSIHEGDMKFRPNSQAEIVMKCGAYPLKPP